MNPKHGEPNHFCHGGCAGYAKGGAVPETPGIMDTIRQYVMAHGGLGGVDDKSADTAMNVDTSTSTAKNYAEGGVVTAEKPDPSEIPEEIKEFVKKAHKDKRESRPDENWRITPPKKPESVAPYKPDEDTAEETAVPKMAAGGAVPNMDDGGSVGDFSVDTGSSDTLKGLPLNPDIVPQPMPPVAPPAVPPIPTKPPASPVSQPAAATVPAAPAPSPAQPAPTDQDFMTRANSMLGLNPDQQAAFMKLLGHRSQMGQIGAGIAGIGDAIASGGTLGKVNPGAMQKAEDLIQSKQTQGIEGMKTIQEGREKATDLSLKLQANDPNSPLSKYAQKAYGGVGKKLGLDLSHASASLIGDVTGKGVSALNDEAELALKQATLGLQEQQVKATTANQQAERRATDVKNKLEHPFLNVFGKVPSIGVPAGGENFTPDVLTYAQTHGITPQQAQAIKMQRTGAQ